MSTALTTTLRRRAILLRRSRVGVNAARRRGLGLRPSCWQSIPAITLTPITPSGEAPAVGQLSSAPCCNRRINFVAPTLCKANATQRSSEDTLMADSRKANGATVLQHEWCRAEPRGRCVGRDARKASAAARQWCPAKLQIRLAIMFRSGVHGETQQQGNAPANGGKGWQQFFATAASSMRGCASFNALARCFLVSITARYNTIKTSTTFSLLAC